MNGLCPKAPYSARIWRPDIIGGCIGASVMLYGVSALVGVWAAYDRMVALERFSTLLMGMVLMGMLVWYTRRDGLTVLYHLCQACAILASMVSIYFLCNHDWGAGQQSDFAPLQTWAVALQKLRPQVALPLNLHENLVANILSALMPLSAGAALFAQRKRHVRVTRGAIGALLLSTVALMMTFSRGAWMGLAVGTLVALYAYWRTGLGRQSAWRYGLDLIFVGGAVVFGLIFMVLLMPTVAQKVQLLLPVGSTPATHLRLWQDSLALIRDYRYTGSGLGVSTMVYSTYYFLVHVAYLHHAHNLLLQIGVEQGLPGMIGFWGMIGSAAAVLWRALHSTSAMMRKAAAIGVASLSAMLLHGLTDAELYASSFALVIFLPIGFALSLAQFERRDRPRTFLDSSVSIGGVYSTWQTNQGVATTTGFQLLHEIMRCMTKRKMVGWLIGATPIVSMVALLFLLPGSAAAMRANRGAVLQTRAELAAYQWPEWPVQDAVRHMHIVNLDVAGSEFRTALKLDATNVTANRRLGQLALSIGQYDVARRRLEAAYLFDSDNPTTRQLLGEVYAIQGDVEHSALLWQWTPDHLWERLYMRKWWYEYIGATQEAEWLNEAIVLLQQR